MSNYDPARTLAKRMNCPKCSDKRESDLPQDFYCPTCGRKKSLFLQAFGVHEPTEKEEDDFTIHSLTLRLADMTERHDAHKANYEYMAKRCAEQQKEIEALKAQAMEPGEFEGELALYLEQGAPESMIDVTVDDLIIAIRYFQAISSEAPSTPAAEPKYNPLNDYVMTHPAAEPVKPVCFGLDDCSSHALSVCSVRDECGKVAK